MLVCISGGMAHCTLNPLLRNAIVLQTMMTKIFVELKKETQITLQSFKKTDSVHGSVGFLWPFKKPELTLLEGTDSQSKHSISSLSDVSKQAYAILIMFK